MPEECSLIDDQRSRLTTLNYASDLYGVAVATNLERHDDESPALDTREPLNIPILNGRRQSECAMPIFIRFLIHSIAGHLITMWAIAVGKSLRWDLGRVFF